MWTQIVADVAVFVKELWWEYVAKNKNYRRRKEDCWHLPIKGSNNVQSMHY